MSPDLTLSSSFQWTQNFQTGHGQASRKLTRAKLIWAAIQTFLRTCCPLMPISATDQYHSRLKEAKKGKSNYCKTETGNRTIIKNRIEVYQTVSKSFSKHPQQLNFPFIAFPQEIQFHDMENSYCKMPRDPNTNFSKDLLPKDSNPNILGHSQKSTFSLHFSKTKTEWVSEVQNAFWQEIWEL